MTPRPHAELAARYYADDTLKCWMRDISVPDTPWVLLKNPAFAGNQDIAYHVGHEPPPTKRTITLTVNGREWMLPAPLEGPFHIGRVYYVLGEDGRAHMRTWAHTDIDNICLKNQRMCDTEADAQQWAGFDRAMRGGG